MVNFDGRPLRLLVTSPVPFCGALHEVFDVQDGRLLKSADFAVAVSLPPNMTIYNLYIFDRNGTCLAYQSWNRNKDSEMPQDEEFKLMYGMLYSIKSFVNRMSPMDSKDCFMNYRTSKYKLHFYETPTGLKFVINTDLSVGNITDILHHIYSKVYVEYVVKNPMCRLDEPITSELFMSRLDAYIKSLNIFN